MSMFTFARKITGRVLGANRYTGIVFARLALDERLLPFIVDNAILGQRIAKNPALMKALQRRLRDPKIAAAVFDEPYLLEKALMSPKAPTTLMGDPVIQVRLLKHPELFGSLLQREEFKSDILNCKTLHDALANHPAFVQSLLSDRQALAAIIGRPEVIDELTRHEHLVNRVLNHDIAVRQIPEDESLLAKVLAHPRTGQYLARNQNVLLSFVESGLSGDADGNALYEALKNSPDFKKKFISDESLIEEIVAAPLGLDAVLSNENLLHRIARDDRLLSRILNDQTLTDTIAQDRRMVQQISSNPVLLASFVERGLANDAVGHALYGEFREISDLREKLFADRQLIEDILGLPLTIETLTANSELLQTWLRNEQVLEQLFEDKELIEAILSDGRTKKILLEHFDIFVKMLGGSAEMLKHLASDRNFINAILREDATFPAILSNHNLISRILNDPNFIKNYLANGCLPQLLQTLKKEIHRDEHQKIVKNILADDRTPQIAVQDMQFCRRMLQSNMLASNSELKKYAESRLAFVKIWEKLKPFINVEAVNSFNMPSVFEAKPVDIMEIPNLLMNIFCKDSIAFLRDGSLEFTDRFSLWTVINEILLHEEYFFEADDDSPRIIDCGANFGMAIYYFKSLYPNASITAFEPVPAIYEILKGNVRRNKYSDTEVLPYAVASEEKKSAFLISRTYPLAGSLTDRRKHFGDELEEIQVECKSLSEHLDKPVHFLKLDIEGMEFEVMQSIRDNLHKVQHLFIETHHGAGTDKRKFENLVSILSEADFDFHMGKSYHFQSAHQHRPMALAGEPYSLNIWAKNPNWPH